MPKYKKSKYISWKRYYERKYGKGIASNYIQLANIQKGDRVVIVARVSFLTQKKNGNLKNQVDELILYVESRGGIVIGVIEIVISGIDPFWLRPAAKLAKEHNAIILAASTNRLIRNWYFHVKDNPKLQARTSDLEELKDATLGVKLATTINPDASYSEECSHLTKLGLKNGKKGGRKRGQSMSNKRRREVYQPKAIKLREEGCSYGEIVKVIEVDIPRSTLRDWLKDTCKARRFSPSKQNVEKLPNP